MASDDKTLDKKDKVKLEKKRLGRGLSALLGESMEIAENTGNFIKETIPIEKIEINPHQPRRTFSEEKIEELSISIRNQGLLQPLLVRPNLEKSDYYQIVAGERRWRASMKAGIHDVPVVIREVSDEDMLSLAIVENIQREDLSAIEEAEAYQKLMTTKNLTQNDVAELIGKSRPSIANSLRLLSLSPYIQSLVDEGKLSSGHARTLVGQEGSEDIADRIIAEGWSVRQTEDFVRSRNASLGEQFSDIYENDGYSSVAENKEREDLENLLSYMFNCQVSVDLKHARPLLQLRFANVKDMEALIQKIKHCLWDEGNN